MAHTRDIDLTAPANTEYIGNGALQMRNDKEDLKERMVLDHIWDSSQVTTGSLGDGYHKQVTMSNTHTVSAGKADTGIIHVENDAVTGKAELFFMDEDSNDVQITRSGMTRVESSNSLRVITYKSSTQTIGTSDTKITFTGTPVKNIFSEWDTTNSKFVAASDGIFLITFGLYFSTRFSSTSGQHYTYIYVNNSKFATIHWLYELFISSSYPLALSSGDEVYISIDGASGSGTTDIIGNTSAPFGSYILISKLA